MAAATQIVPELLTLEEYLRTSYRPDCDFVDGQLEERNVGGTKHSLLQMQFAIWFHMHPDWNLRTASQQRTKVGKTRVRLPDVAVLPDDDALLEEPRTTPPFIAIEIMSPDDRMSRIILRLKDFAAMGVRHIWLIDPIERVAWTYTTAGLDLVEGNLVTLPDSPVYLDLTWLFKSIETRSSRNL